MSDALTLMTSLQILAKTFRAGQFDPAMMAETLDRLANAVGRIEIECHAQRQMQNTRAFHRHLEDQAMKALHELGALPEPALPFQPIKTAKDLKADNVTPFRPRDRDKT